MTLLLGLVLLIITKYTRGETVIGMKFTPENNMAGIIFSPVSQVQLSYLNWHLLYYYDLTEFNTEIETINESIEKLENMCSEKIETEKTKGNGTCSILIQQLKRQCFTLEHKNNIIRAYQTRKDRRRRAAMEIVGTLAHGLFGILDADTARHYDGEIDKLKQNNKYQIDLMKRQTLIIEKTVKLQNITANDNSNKLQTLINSIELIKKEQQGHISTLQWENYFNSISIFTNLLIFP